MKKSNLEIIKNLFKKQKLEFNPSKVEELTRYIKQRYQLDIEDESGTLCENLEELIHEFSANERVLAAAHEEKAQKREMTDEEAEKEIEKLNLAHDESFTNVEGQEGKVLIFNEAGQTLIGTYVGPGRTIGEGVNETPTLKFVDLENNIILLPCTTVLNAIAEFNKANEVVKSVKYNTYMYKITYLGRVKKNENDKGYHNYRLEFKQCPRGLKSGKHFNITNAFEMEEGI
jgi:hypothetical protein